jgi:hypothetical protein
MMPDPIAEPATNLPAGAATELQPAAPVLSYATPFGYESGVWRSGKYVVVSDDADLPNRCVRCNGVAKNRLTLHAQPWRAPLHVGLCRQHVVYWWFWRTIGLICVTFGALVLVMFGAVFWSVLWSWSELKATDIVNVVFCLGLLSGMFFLPPLLISRFLKPLGHMTRKGNTVWLWPSGRAFRDSLRELDSEPESSPSKGRT